jgi:hypothetical protein
MLRQRSIKTERQLCPQSRPQALALRMSDLGCKVQIETLIAIANQDRFWDRFMISY